LVTRVRSLTVAKLLSIGFVVRRWRQCFGWKRVERGEVLPVAVELVDGLGVLGRELLAERLQRVAGVAFGRGLHHLVQQRLGPRLQPLGEGVEDVGDLVDVMPTSA